MLVNYSQMTYTLRERKWVQQLSWITLVHEFTSPHTFIQSLFTKIFPVTQPTKLRPHKAGKPFATHEH